jgi:hypothetical protein
MGQYGHRRNGPFDNPDAIAAAKTSFTLLPEQLTTDH